MPEIKFFKDSSYYNSSPKPCELGIIPPFYNDKIKEIQSSQLKITQVTEVEWNHWCSQFPDILFATQSIVSMMGHVLKKALKPRRHNKQWEATEILRQEGMLGIIGFLEDNLETLCIIEWNVGEACWAPDKENIKWYLISLSIGKSWH